MKETDLGLKPYMTPQTFGSSSVSSLNTMDHSRTRAASFYSVDNMDYRPRIGVPLPAIDHMNFASYRPPFFAWERLDSARPRLPAGENPSRVTDFSVERILSGDLGNKTPMEQNGSYMASGMYGFPYWHCFSYPTIEPQVYPQHFTSTRQQTQDEEWPTHQQQPQPWKPRARTVFTDSQLQRLEKLFERTRYPSPETRSEVARSIGLSEDTVRIWFKNHRARRKNRTGGPQSTQNHL